MMLSVHIFLHAEKQPFTNVRHSYKVQSSIETWNENPLSVLCDGKVVKMNQWVLVRSRGPGCQEWLKEEPGKRISGLEKEVTCKGACLA